MRYLLAVAALAACTPPAHVAPLAATTPTIAPDYAPPAGALNPAVTQATIGATICTPGWTATIRPPTSYTTPLKLAQMAARHLPGSPADYSEDHYVALAVGGAPRDPANLWPEKLAAAHLKDRAEVRLHTAVCAGTMTLADAQAAIVDPNEWHG